MVDADGTFAYSKIAWALPETGYKLRIYPNPVKDQFMIDSPLGAAELSLINNAGLVVETRIR